MRYVLQEKRISIMATLVNNSKRASGQSLMSIAKEKIQHVFNAYVNSLSKALFPVEGENASKAHAYMIAMMK